MGLLKGRGRIPWQLLDPAKDDEGEGDIEVIYGIPTLTTKYCMECTESTKGREVVTVCRRVPCD